MCPRYLQLCLWNSHLLSFAYSGCFLSSCSLYDLQSVRPAVCRPAVCTACSLYDLQSADLQSVRPAVCRPAVCMTCSLYDLQNLQSARPAVCTTCSQQTCSLYDLQSVPLPCRRAPHHGYTCAACVRSSRGLSPVMMQQRQAGGSSSWQGDHQRLSQGARRHRLFSTSCSICACSGCLYSLLTCSICACTECLYNLLTCSWTCDCITLRPVTMSLLAPTTASLLAPVTVPVLVPVTASR
jgi:hypothetical protein